MAERVTRIDVGRLDKFERTPTGGLRIPAALTRVGVLTYQDAAGNVIRELRPPDEVFAAESIATLEDAAVTDLHPDANVTPQTWKRDAVGHVKGPKADTGAGRILGEVLVQDAREIALIESGERVEVSSGYSVELDRTPGVFEGEPYDVVQRRIRYNHVGLGPAGWGRAGPEIALRLDAAHELVGGAQPSLPETRSGRMTEIIKLDGVEYEYGSRSHVQALEKRANDAVASSSQLQGRFDTLEERVVKLTSERDAAVKRADEASSPENLDAAVQARLGLVDRARRVLGADFTGEGLADAEIMGQTLEAQGVALTDEQAANADYVRGRFEAITDAGPEDEGAGGEGGDAPPPEDDPNADGKGRGDSKRRRADARPRPKVRTTTTPPKGAELDGLDKVKHDSAEFIRKGGRGFALSK